MFFPFYFEIHNGLTNIISTTRTDTAIYYTAMMLWLAFIIKGTVIQIEKAQINNRLCVSKVSWKFRIPTIYNFAVTDPWNLLFLRLRETHNAWQLPVFFFFFFFSASVIRNVRKFGAKNYFTDHQTANTIDGFKDSVPVLKTYERYYYTQKFGQLSIPSQR